MTQIFPVTSDNERTMRAFKEEQEAFMRLYIERNLAWQLLTTTDRLLASENVPNESFGDLHLAALRYQDAVKAVQTAVQKDAALAYQEPQYKKKLRDQMIEVDRLLTQL